MPSSSRQRIFQMLFVFAALISTIAALRPVPPELALSGQDKLAHGLVFLILSLLLDAAYGGFDVRAAILLAAGGVVVETLQLFQPTRQFSPLDMMANCCGIALYWAGRCWLFNPKDA